MGTFILMFKNVFIFVALAIPGFILAKSKMIPQDKTVSISKIITYVGVPFLILDSTIRMDFGGDTLIVLIIAGVLSLVVTSLAFFATKPLTTGFDDVKRWGVARFAMFSSNNGFLGIPLARAVFGVSDVLSVVVIANVLSNILFYAFGTYLISGDKNKISVKNILLNPLLIAFILGVIINLTGANNYLPEITTYTGYLSSIVTPLSMILLGLKMGAVDFKELIKNKNMYYVSSIKLIAFPVIVIGVLVAVHQFIQIPYAIIMGLFIAFSMPTASVCTTFADQFNSDTKGAVAYTLSTTILSILTISVLYAILTIII